MQDRNFKPFPVLKTGRLTLRRLESSDDQEIFALRSNEEVNKYLDRKRSQSLDDAKNFIQIINDKVEKNDSVYWAITWNSTDKLIGTICLFGFSEDGSKAEVGYELLPGFQGKGIMQEAVTAVTDFGKHIGLKSIEAYTHAENLGSTRLLEHSKFQKRGTGQGNLLVFELTLSA